MFVVWDWEVWSVIERVSRGSGGVVASDVGLVVGCLE